MIRRVLLLFLLALLLMGQTVAPSSYQGGYARTPHESLHPEYWQGLVAAWIPQLGVTGLGLRDVSGRSNHGTLTDMTPASDWVQGDLARAPGWVLDYDGSNDYVRIGQHASLRPATITVIAWVKPSASPGAWAVVVNHPYRTTGWTDPFVSWQITRNSTNGYTTFAGSTGGALFQTDDTGGTEWSSQTWFQAALVYDGETAFGYINGVQTSSDATPTGALSYDGSTPDVSIGQRSPHSVGDFLSGQIGPILVYNRPLSPAQIYKLYTDPLAPFREQSEVFAFVPQAGGAALSPMFFLLR